MPKMLILGRGGSINQDRVVAVAPVSSSPVQKLLQAVGEDRVLNMTYGYPRQSVILFENGMIAVTSRTVEELTKALHMDEELDHDFVPWW